MIESFYLSKNSIREELSAFIDERFKIEGELYYDLQIKPIFDILDDKIAFYFEYPYVEKYYRDSFYSFFSKKHKSYEKNCIRISIFKDQIKEDDFINFTDNYLLQENFLGYITIRPTTYRIIGHSFISPKALKVNGFVCCLSTEEVLINGNKLSISGFPYISQDNESITCSESTILCLIDYFSHKYSEYSLLLPSYISKILSKHSPERQLPSKGLPTDNISFVLKKIGFGTVVYSNDKKSKNVFSKRNFREILFAYIESGIPIIAMLSSKQHHHAVLVIGRKNINKDIKISHSLFKKKKCRPISDALNKVLIMDDNQPPYKLVNYKSPIYDIESKNYYKFKAIIVPLYPKIHLEAYQFKTIFFDVLDILHKNLDITLVPKNKKFILRYYVTSCKSYKHYISTSTHLSVQFKSLIIDTAMPRFIWVGEILLGDTIHLNQEVHSVLVLDSTESGKSGQLVFASKWILG